MLDSALSRSPAIQRVQSIVARALFRIGMTAGAATIAGAAAGVLAGIFFSTGAIARGIVSLAVSAGLDAIDGTIARQCAAPSAIGGVLDLCCDRIVEAAVIVGIAWPRPELYLPAFVLVATWYINITVFLAVGAALSNRGPKLIEYPPGILERSEALVFLAVLAISGAWPLTREIGPLLCYAFAGLEMVTGAQRLMFGYRILSVAGDENAN